MPFFSYWYVSQALGWNDDGHRYNHCDTYVLLTSGLLDSTMSESSKKGCIWLNFVLLLHISIYVLYIYWGSMHIWWVSNKWNASLTHTYHCWAVTDSRKFIESDNEQFKVLLTLMHRISWRRACAWELVPFLYPYSRGWFIWGIELFQAIWIMSGNGSSELLHFQVTEKHAQKQKSISFFRIYTPSPRM